MHGLMQFVGLNVIKSNLNENKSVYIGLSWKVKFPNDKSDVIWKGFVLLNLEHMWHIVIKLQNKLVLHEIISEFENYLLVRSTHKASLTGFVNGGLHSVKPFHWFFK